MFDCLMGRVLISINYDLIWDIFVAWKPLVNATSHKLITETYRKTLESTLPTLRISLVYNICNISQRTALRRYTPRSLLLYGLLRFVKI